MDSAAVTERSGAVRGSSATWQRIVDAATVLFYAHGIRATSAERVIERVGITKVTFYRYFPTKSDLVVAYLTQQVERDMRVLARAGKVTDPREALRLILASVQGAMCADGFRGCPFLNAAMEFPDPGDPVRAVIDAHRQSTRTEYAGVAAAAGCIDPGRVADQLLILRDGAMLGGYLDRPDTIADAFTAACLEVVAAGGGEVYPYHDRGTEGSGAGGIRA